MMAEFRSSVYDSQPFSAMAQSVSSGTTTKRDPRGRNPLYGSTGQIGRTNRTEFTGPSVLVARVGANAGSVYSVDGAYGVTDNTLVVRLRPGQSVSFVTQLLKHAELNRLVYGSGQPLVTGTMLKNLDVPAVTAGEQARIAAVLDDANARIGALERLIAKKRTIKQGLMQQLLTGRTRLPGFDVAWSEVSVGTVATVIMGQSPSGATYNGEGHGLPLIQGNADIRDRVTFDRVWTTGPTKTCEAGDVLLTVRAPVGYTAIASKRSCLGRGVCALRAGGDNRFLFHALVYAEPAWKLYEQGSTFTAVNSGEVRSFVIRWPLDAGERAAVAAALDDSDRELLVLQTRLTKARAIKTGMMQQLLTGRVRLPMEASA